MTNYSNLLLSILLVCLLTVPYTGVCSADNIVYNKLNHETNSNQHNTIQSIDLHLSSVSTHNELRSILSQLRTYTFYRIFAVNLYSDCKYWNDAHQCAEIGCAVCGECSAEQLPVEWLNEVSAHKSQVNDTISDTVQTWSDEERHLWIYQDNSNVNDIKYIDIAYNPEGYTGYVGEAAHKIWSAIYLENCFVLDSIYNTEQQCYERKVFYKLISGIHSTISAHISWNWPTHLHYYTVKHTADNNIFNTPVYSHHTIFDAHDDNPVLTSPNVDVYIDKLGLYTDRIDNLRFTYTVLLRAVNKASSTLLEYDYITGNDTEQAQVQYYMSMLLHNDAIKSCTNQVSFDEKSMFNGQHSMQLKQEFQQHFRNVSAIMDCVGCEKCRLHGKLQVLGIGTALRILFEPQPVLQRNEIMSLIVTLSKVADALYYVQQLQETLRKQISIPTELPVTDLSGIHNRLNHTSLNNTTDLFIQSYSTTEHQSLGIAVMFTLTLFSVIITYIYLHR